MGLLESMKMANTIFGNFLDLFSKRSLGFTLVLHSGVYAALAVAKLTNILDQVLVDNCLQFVISCQTYEGGFGGQPMNEAHGGYTYCAMAALVLLCEYYQTAEQQSSGQLDFLKENLKKINWTALLCWIIDRQRESKLGGFQGRTNKLVDSCYSYWIGSLIPILRFFSDTFPITIEGPLRWDPVALITYVLDACQNNACPEENGPTCTLNEEEYASPVGGMLDKPEKYPDYYHTCYALSGLCIAVHDIDFLNLTEKEDLKAKLNLEHLPALHLAFCLPATCVEIMGNFFL